MASEVAYTASDCLFVLKNGKPAADPHDEFLSYIQNTSQSIDCFRISKHERENKYDPVVFFDYGVGQWRSGRYIGNIEYCIGRKRSSLTVEPRFGDSILLEMFGEIFNLKLSSGKSSLRSNKKAVYVKMLISFIWTQKLAEANRHGLPRKRVTIDSRGYSVKGKLRINPSILSYGKNRTVVSQSHEIEYDETIISIVSAAYRVLKQDYAFEQLSLSPNIKNIVADIESIGHGLKVKISEKDYQSITYQPIYKSFKDLVDFSWQILNSSTGVDTQGQGSNVSGYLIDMAEVWECYIRSIVQNQLRKYGWKLIESTFTVYENTFFRRKIIPDIVFEKDGEYCVFDAKYKKMLYRSIDVDREDFFQIHTYISYIQHLGKVKLAGLFYPVEEDSESLSTSAPLYNLEDTCKFIADGPSIGNDTINKRHIFELIENCITSKRLE